MARFCRNRQSDQIVENADSREFAFGVVVNYHSRSEHMDAALVGHVLVIPYDAGWDAVISLRQLIWKYALPDRCSYCL